MRDKITRTLSGLKTPSVPRLQTQVRFLCSCRGLQYGGSQLGGVRRRPPWRCSTGLAVPRRESAGGRPAGSGPRWLGMQPCKDLRNVQSRPWRRQYGGGRTPTRQTAPSPARRGLRRLPHRRANRAASAPPRPALRRGAQGPRRLLRWSFQLSSARGFKWMTCSIRSRSSCDLTSVSNPVLTSIPKLLSSAPTPELRRLTVIGTRAATCR